MLTVKDLKKDLEIQELLRVTEIELEVLGFTEHSNRHVSIVSKWAGDILRELGGTEREIRQAEIAGYLHDIGNAINRLDHAQSGALLAYHILTSRGESYTDAAEVMLAIGNHDESNGEPVSRVTAALIIADKADVHKSRVRRMTADGVLRNPYQDIHDRVNMAAESSFLDVDNGKKTITLNIAIDTEICSVMDYFEIYIKRMSLCKKAANFLGCHFSLRINNTQLL